MSWCIAFAVSRNTPDRDERVLREFRAEAARPHNGELTRETLRCLGEIAALASSAIDGGVLIESSGHLDASLKGGGTIELRIKSFNVLESAPVLAVAESVGA